MIATSMLSIVTQLQEIKYNLKYLDKGSDQATVTIEDNAAAGCITQQETDTNNEVEQFQNKQYVRCS